MRWTVAALVLLALGNEAAGQGSTPPTVRPYLWSAERPKSAIGEINVFRRFSSERTAAMREFYGDVLGLPVLPETAAGGGQMIRYPVGASEVKLFPVAPSPANTARVADAVGVRLLTFFYADEAAVTQRFAAHGFPAPSSGGLPRTQARAPRRSSRIRTANGSSSSSFRAPRPTRSSRFEIGITVSDLAASRAFYGELMGLAPQPPVRDELLGTVKHPFKHGNTTINLWSFGAEFAQGFRDWRESSTSSGTWPRSMRSCRSAVRRSIGRYRRRVRCERCGCRIPTASATTSRNPAATTTRRPVSS